MSGVIVGIDRSATARVAAERAARLAAAVGEPLHVVMAVKSGRTQTMRSGNDTFFLDWVTETREFLRDLVAELGAPDATFAIGGKDPARSVCDEARRIGASLIVVGNRRTQGAARALGSVAADVLRQAPCDVVVAHTMDAADRTSAPDGFGVSSAKVFERCSKKQRRAIDELATPAAVSAGDVLTRQGDIGREFGVLLGGTATVSIDGEDVATLRAGDHFGEIALLDPGDGNSRRNATITADVDLWASMMSIQEFDALISRYPDIAEQLRDEVGERAGAR